MRDASTTLRRLDDAAKREAIKRLIMASHGKLMRGDDPRLARQEVSHHA